MEMEDHHHHHHHHHQQQYAITDLRQLVNGPRSAHFPSIPPQPTAELFPGHPNLTTAAHQQQHYEMMMFGRQVADIMPRCLHDFASADAADASIAVATTPTPTPTTTTTTSASTPPLSGLGADAAGCIGGDASTGRWPRQETLTLLEIRSRLDLKFKEANQKGPLWDEVSRIMCEEHGYQRSGKKCREKFENLYKYYKKTKEGKAGRQDGKHYRFFRQLEALYGGENSNNNNNNTGSAPETTNLGSSSHQRNYNNAPNNNHQETTMPQSQKQCDSLSLTNSTEFETSSSEEEEENEERRSTENSAEKGRRSKRGWKVKVKEFIDVQMRKLVEKQEEWLEKLTRTLEQKEKERALREEEWRLQEAARLEREHKFWAKERAWIEARDAALMEALQKLTGNNTDQIIKAQAQAQAQAQSPPHEAGRGGESWQEQLGNGKKRKENSRTCFYFENNNGQSSSLYNSNQASAGYCDINDQRQEEAAGRMQRTNDGSSPSSSNVGSAVHGGDTGCFPFFMTEGGNLWDNYSLKVNKANQNH